MPFFIMNKQKYVIYLASIFMSIVITMFISSVVTFKSLDDLSLFWQVWPVNWFYAILIAFPAIMIFRPICQIASEKIISLLIKD